MQKTLVRCQETLELVGEISLPKEAFERGTVTFVPIQPFDPLKPSASVALAHAEMKMTDRTKRKWALNDEDELLVPERDLRCLPDIPEFRGFKDKPLR